MSSTAATLDLDLTNQLMNMQPMQPISQLNELFYQPPNDDNFYHVTFKLISQPSENSEVDYDYEFFYDTNYYVTCKLFPLSLIIDMLNKEIYEIDFDVYDLRRKRTLTLNKKINLERSLKQDLPFLEEQILKSDFTNVLIDQILTTQQSLQSNELRLFYQPPNDVNIYNVTSKITLQDHHQNDDDDYDYEFFYQISDDLRHVTCKLLPSSLITGILNKKIYGIDFDTSELKRKHTLNLQQKLNLELNLRQIFLHIHEKEMRSDHEGNTISFRGNIESNATQTVSVIDSQSYFDNDMSHDGHENSI
ncbi:hypothetical protein RclHR1_02320014 [Rhizophagus clarus]|uniref:Uncharacterized protein n=1 Tax=Rhizophagus clarus TaxID=94130 RepID=A0A2Z6R944_9GLOM|nr:hypothetical protein RclHR1_02320014 [Rhizophagus clarus]GES85885.1 hypothetical protein GLOIN_2v1871429 [Rhizophagus clarus]